MDLITFFFILFAAIVIILNIFALYWFGGMVIPAFVGGGPYVPTPDKVVKQMINLASIKPGDTVVDLGSGDGRLIIAAVKAGAMKAVGYEIHPGLVRLSKFNLKKNGMQGIVEIENKTMWKADLKKANVVFIYQFPYTMKRIERMLKNQLAPGSRIISHAFEFQDWKPDKRDGLAILYTIK